MIKFDISNGVGDEENGGVTVKSFKEFINANKNQEIQLDISTMGGDLETALVIYDLLKSHPKHTKANLYGLTASAGTVIAMGCDEIEQSSNTLFLIHNSLQGPISGNVFDFQKAASDLMKFDAIMIRIYKERTGLDETKIRDLMKAEDWLSADEAERYGFIDRVYNSGIKIAASVMLSGAKNKINEQLLIKLEKKMKIFGKDKAEKPTVMNVLALKGEKSVLINAEEPATGVEVAPLGAMTLEDGEYELADGRKILVAGGVITEVMEEAAPEPEASADTEAIIAAVGGIVAEAIAGVEAKFEERLSKIQSTHTPPKGKQLPGSPAASVDPISKVNAITDGIRKNLVESRKS